jgi:selenocysteine-specific elongation factor
MAMKSIIVGTAGHIDHGKTALVKALTGIDADRLEEEKRRGITIDLGFAHMDLPATAGSVERRTPRPPVAVSTDPGLQSDGRTRRPRLHDPSRNDSLRNEFSEGMLRLGFVDVPGHERFVRNMLAGVGGIDLVLLVIAADESIMPQTREHFDILQLLGVRRGIAVITKSDAVDAETLDVVRMEVEEFLRGSFLEGQPIVAVSSLTGAGLEELKRAMIAAAVEVRARDAQALARLPIDRVFTMKGFGTVVTGTLISGTIHREGELEVFPTGRRVRVRGVQVHGKTAEAAVAGQRTALNLAGASTEDLARGMTLAPADTFVTTQRVDVKLRLLASAPRSLKDGARVHFHSHTMERVGEIGLYGIGEKNTEGISVGSTVPTQAARDAAWMGHPHSLVAGKKNSRSSSQALLRRELAPGREAYAQIRLAEGALLLPGDRFILRQFSPVVTIGGGVVLDAAPMRSVKESRKLEKTAGGSIEAGERMAELLGSGSPEAILTGRVKRRGMRGLTVAEAMSETGWRRGAMDQLGTRLLESGELVRFQDRMFAAEEFELAQRSVLGAISGFHRRNPLNPGMSKGEMQDELQRALHIAPELFEDSLASLVKAKKLEVVNDLVRLPGHAVVMKDDEAESKKTIEAAFATAGLKVPALHEVIAGLKVDKVRAQKIVTLLLRDKVLMKISDELVFHRQALEELRRQMGAFKSKSTKIDVAKFKEMTGVSRKYAIPLMEYLDRERVTRRVGDAREIL